jgi:acyl dehydratase
LAFFLDDLVVGQRFISGTYALDEDEMKSFARKYDPQYFHTDNEAASNSIFGGLAASGWYTAAVTMKLNVESGLPIMGGIVGSGGEINWPKPTRAGDVLHVESEILEIVPSRSRPDRGMVTVLCRTVDQNGETVQNFKAKLVVPRRPAP